MKLQRRLACCVGSVFAGTTGGASFGQAQEPSYKGKCVIDLINFTASGPTDLEGHRAEEMRRVLVVSPEVRAFIANCTHQEQRR